MHKTGNVRNTLPKTVQAEAKWSLHGIWQVPTLEDAEAAFDALIETYEPKYPNAVALVKDRDVLLISYDFPAPHWQHLRPGCRLTSTSCTRLDDSPVAIWPRVRAQR